MTDSLRPWILVNQYIQDDEYRKVVVTAALTYLPQADRELQRFAAHALNHISVPGFPSFAKANNPRTRHRVMPIVMRLFQRDPAVAIAIICLWSEASRTIVDELRNAAVGAGLQFTQDWSWERAQSGYLDFDAVPALAQIAETLASRRSHPESDHLQLAVLWLSGALVSGPKSEEHEQAVFAEDSIQPHQEEAVSLPIEPSEIHQVVTHSDGPGVSSESQDQQAPEPRQVAPLVTPPVNPMPAVPIGDHLVDNSIGDQDLPQLRASLEKGLERLAQMQRDTSRAAEVLLAAANAHDLDETVRCQLEVEARLTDWGAAQDGLLGLVKTLSLRLEVELQARPDLVIQKAETSDSPSDKVQAVQTIMSEIEAYDKTKADVIAKLRQLIAQTRSLRDQISEWNQEVLRDTESPLDELALDGLTLSEITGQLARMTERNSMLLSVLHQLRTDAQERVLRLRAQLQTEGEPDETLVAERMSLSALNTNWLMQLSSVDLRAIGEHLTSLLETRRKARQQASQTCASALREEWSAEGFRSLLVSLAHEDHDEATLLCLLAGSAAHPDESEVVIDDVLARSLISAATNWSPKENPYGLFGALIPDLVKSSAIEPGLTQARLCLALLGAQYGGNYRLPSEMIWEIATEWPLPSMPAWKRLWEAVTAQEQRLAITSASVADDRELNEARSRAVLNLARDKVGYQRLLALQSIRHRTVFGRELMPSLAEDLTHLQQIETELKNCRDEATYRKRLAKLEGLVQTELGSRLAEDEVTERYESAISAAGIDDANPFHHRTAFRLLLECSESVLEYGQRLLDYAREQLTHKGELYIEDLTTELMQTDELKPLGKAVLSHINGRLLDAQERTEVELRREASQLITRIILSNGQFAFAMPHLVGHLIEHEYQWATLWEPLLFDLAEPVDAAGAGAILLEHDALSQALLISGGLTPEQRKQAQMQSLERNREIGELQTALMTLGGAVDDTTDDLELGRWRLVRRTLQARLAKYQAIRESENRSRQQQALQVRRQINDLDIMLFEANTSMPHDAYTLVQQGLDLARQALGQSALLNDVRTFVDEIRYRLEHTSWPLTELQTAIDRLDQSLRGETVMTPSELNADSGLDLLERGELRRLGLSPAHVTTSEIDTRCELLRSWIQVRSLKGFSYEEQRSADREAIQRLIQYFAQMVSLKHERAEGGRGKPIAYEAPIVFSHWRLQYPETNILDTICILLALPGQPPSTHHLRELEQIIESKGWLDGEFVLVFAPGCTAAIQKRLQTNYHKRGLVVIDERIMLDLVLAEVSGSTPVGRLRPKMLNALQAETVDVFKVNQLVNPRTAIFVGRDALTSRLARSGDSYALYGGRRIGKSSVLAEVQRLLDRKGVMTIFHSWEGERDYSDDACAVRLGNLLALEPEVHDLSEFKAVLQEYLDANANLTLVLLLDEIDKYIVQNPDRHGFIEALRSLTDRYGGRFRVIVAGFVSLHDCLNGRGPYTPTSDPWRRMFNDLGPVENLRSVSAEKIVREGFIEILGWNFENRSLPQLIVQRTGGHPAFVQEFCRQLQHRVGRRDDHTVLASDVEAVFADRDPEQSFVAYVRKTLEMNLDAIGRYLLLWLAKDDSGASGFTLDQMREYASLCRCTIPDDKLQRSLERLKVNSVVRERTSGVFEFTVRDYPQILAQLGQTTYLEKWEREIEKEL